MGSMRRKSGEMILRFAPVMMKTLSVLGTAAMFLVGGGILVHGVPILATWLHGIEHITHALPVAADLFSGIAALVYNAVIGIAAGGMLVGTHSLVKRLRPA
jgi:predicted DNA repair protein MutK